MTTSNPAATKVDADIPIGSDGTTYHVKCKSDDLADRIVLVGDPGRVEIIASYLDENSIRSRSTHREICMVTGTYKGTPVTVLSTGMGTDNIEIVLNEIHLLKEYDVQRRQWKCRVGDAGAPSDGPLFDPSRVKIIRFGTCGCPAPSVPPLALAITRHCIGMDNTCLYYTPESRGDSPDQQEIRRVVREQTGLKAINVYTSRAHPNITNSIVAACEAHNRDAKSEEEKHQYVVGTTATASGFYACQGRPVGRFANCLTVPNMTEDFSKLKFSLSTGEEIVSNIEMKTSALCCLSGILGYQAGSVCMIVSKRTGEKSFFTEDQMKKTLTKSIKVVLDALVSVP
uniref:Putative nucleoside phosphorylase n=1 Tax=Trypanosoma congolense (strain IL3000) TaxID=1068625 RepID=G0US35_TRYCI|nr:putative nucleoside phosphorylase [Trypanosoma congolense IL3000]